MWKIACFCVALAIAVSGPARADVIKADGCAELARVVYDEVQSSALYGPGKSGPWTISPAQGDIRECSSVVETVSRAFASAMSSAGHGFRWITPLPGNGDICLSHKLSECYPELYPQLGSGSGLILNSWSVVSGSVMRQMHNPHSSDTIRFRSDDLRLQMGLGLRSIGRVRYGVFGDR